MEKIVIDLDGGLTRLSDEAIELYAQRSGDDIKWIKYLNYHEPGNYCLSHNPILADVVTELGDRANGKYACLTVVEVPDHYEGVVHRYRDGRETVELKWQEDYLRELIQAGNEDDIVKYVKGELY